MHINEARTLRYCCGWPGWMNGHPCTEARIYIMAGLRFPVIPFFPQESDGGLTLCDSHAVLMQRDCEIVRQETRTITMHKSNGETYEVEHTFDVWDRKVRS